jgi:hypothetical protein
VTSAFLPALVSADTFTFAGTTFRSCWEDTEGFTPAPDLQPNPLPAGNPPGTHFVRLTTIASSQTVTFNSDGSTSSSDNLSTSIRNTATSRIGVSNVTCNGTWTFDQATQRIATTGTCNFTNTIGGSSTGTLTSHSIYRLAGTTLVRIDPDTPIVETVDVLTGPGAPFSYQRVCGSSGTLHLAQ